MANKLSPRIRGFLLEIKKNNPQLSCRKACSLVERKFLVKLSKSRVNLLWKEKELSQSVGRIASKKATLKTQFEHAGFLFLLASDTQLQATRVLTENTTSIFPRITPIHLQKVLQGLLFQRLFPNSEIWTIRGYNFNDNKALSIHRRLEEWLTEFQGFLDNFALLQQEITSINLVRQDNSQFVLDGQLRSLCLGQAPEAFARSVDVVKNEVASIFLARNPLILFAIPGFSLYGQEIVDFLVSLQGIDPAKAIARIDLKDSIGNSRYSFSQIPPKSHSIIFGLWPWQYQVPANMKPKGGYHRLWFAPLKREFLVGESELSITQLNTSHRVMIRLIYIKDQTRDAPTLILGTNIPKSDAKTKDIALLYLNRWPCIDSGFQEYMELQKQKLSSWQLQVPELNRLDLETILEHILSTLSYYAQRHFFPHNLTKEGFSHLKQHFYSLPAKIQYHKKAIFVEFLLPADFEYGEEVAFACRRVNEAGCMLPRGVRIWLKVA